MRLFHIYYILKVSDTQKVAYGNTFFSFECWSNISSLWKIQFISYKKNGKNWQKKILVVITLSVQKGSQSFFNFTAVLFLIIFQSIRSFSLIFAVNYIPSLYAVCVFLSSLYFIFRIESSKMARSNQYAYMDEEFVGPGLLCIICRKPFKDPRCTPCNHVFCRECITKWIAENRASCPACRRTVSFDSLSPISDALNNMLGRLYVKCLLCGQTKLRRANFDDHIRRVCPNAHVFRPFIDIQPPLLFEHQHPPHDQLHTCTSQPFLSMLSELFIETRQIREHSQQQQNQIHKYETEIQRLTERCNHHETLINELRSRKAGNIAFF
jgi:hypothetical protein